MKKVRKKVAKRFVCIEINATFALVKMRDTAVF